MTIKKKGLTSLFVTGLILGSAYMTQNTVKADDLSKTNDSVEAVQSGTTNEQTIAAATNDEQAVVNNSQGKTAVTNGGQSDTNDGQLTMATSDQQMETNTNSVKSDTNINSKLPNSGSINLSIDDEQSVTNSITAPDQTASATQASSYVDTDAVSSSILNELNNLRAQNGLSQMYRSEQLVKFAQYRANQMATAQVADHSGWEPSLAAPYDQNPAENVGSAPLQYLPDDANAIGIWFIKNFYTEEYDSESNYGHRKNLLEPYTKYVGIAAAISNGNIFVAMDFGNDPAAQSSFNQKDMANYLDSYHYNFANNSVYDKISYDTDHTRTSNYYPADIIGGVTTKSNQLTNVYHRDGSQYPSLHLAPNTQWASDIIANINNHLYMRVTTDGFVDIDEVMPWATIKSGNYLTVQRESPIYDDNFNNTGRTVPAGSEWSVDRAALNSSYYRIGTNQWVSAEATLY